jgi:copper oxidase (laccase) domain-containing protein
MEFVARFEQADAENGRFFLSASRLGHAMFDLPGYIHARLHAAGVLMVDDIDLCTYADEDSFFSYRRSTHRKEADYGRHIHAIVLEG